MYRVQSGSASRIHEKDAAAPDDKDRSLRRLRLKIR